MSKISDSDRRRMTRNEILRLAAQDFAGKASKLESVREIVLFGSVTRGKPEPKDVDIAAIIGDTGEMPLLAKYSRQMSGYYYSWEVFLFLEDYQYIGRVCFRKECPTSSIDCYRPGCGEIVHVSVMEGFKLDLDEFFKNPMEVLWKTTPVSRFRAWEKSHEASKEVRELSGAP